MSLTATVNSAVEQAFKAASDLVKTGVLQEETVEGFDWSSGSTIGSPEPFLVEFIETSSVVEADRSIKKEIIVRAEDLDTSRYSTLEIEGRRFLFEKITEYVGVKEVTLRSA